MIRPDAARLDNRSRGNAAQQLERYKALARDATQSGDRITAEYYHQYADHYFRVLNENRPRYEEQRPQTNRDWQERDSYSDVGETDDARDDERTPNHRAYSDRGNSEAYARGGEQGYDRGYRDDGAASVREEPTQTRNDRPREEPPREARQQNDRQRDDRALGDRQRDERSRQDRVREDRVREDRPRDERPRENGSANRDQRPRRERWVQQGGAEPTDPPVPSREVAASVSEQSAEREAQPVAAQPVAEQAAPRRGRPRRVEAPSDDPFAVRRAPEPVLAQPETAAPVASTPELSDEPVAPVRRRRARKAEPDNDAERSLENA